jgi:hypothetical protein
MPELEQVSDKIAAALIGVAPYDDDSGRRRGERHIKGGRRWVRNAIYMPCLGAATQNNPVLKAFYQRLIARERRRRVALTARIRKLVVILNTHRTTAEMGSSPLRSCLASAPCARFSTERMHSHQTGARAGSRPTAAEGGGAQRQP